MKEVPLVAKDYFMVIKDVLDQLQHAQHPVAKALHKCDHCKVLVLAFKKGMALKDHTAHQPTKLVVINGNVVYTEGGKEVTLHQYDEIDIPVEAEHAVKALEDSLCLLTQG